ncbi:MAG: transcriptional regulator GcvA [Burkholderiales bacterium]
MNSKPFELPPLNLIEGFEAAARNLSFTKAAQELFLTQSAVSRQIKTLEERLGVPLFQRRTRSLILTEAGATLYLSVADVLRRLDETTKKIRGRASARSFTLTTTPSFASLWLIPRLAGYTKTRPQVDVRISATNDVINLERQNIELAIRYGRPGAAAGAVKLFHEEVIPVCSPALLRDQARPLMEPADLKHHVLLHFDDPSRDAPWLSWPTWLQAMGLADLKPAGALHFDQYDQMVGAATSGQGVALGRNPLLARQLKEGKLAAPFSTRTVAPRSYYLIESKAAARNADVGDFVAWLRAEASVDLLSEARVKRSARKSGDASGHRREGGARKKLGQPREKRKT